MRIVGIIQARLASSRLPEKAFAEIEGKPLLWRVVHRARQIAGLADIVVATSFSERDRQLVHWCQRQGITVLRGGSAEADVLGRLYDVGIMMLADAVARITGDCPLLCPKVSGLVVGAYRTDKTDRTDKYDLVTNAWPATWPDGLDTEVISMEALERAHRLATAPADREHVTSYCYEHPEQFAIHNVAHSVDGHLVDLSGHRWCVDDGRDLEFVRAVYRELGQDLFGMDEVLALLEANPELRDLNSGTPRNEGLALSKRRDKAKKALDRVPSGDDEKGE